MIKSSFVVEFNDPNVNNHIVLGVTSIMPNMNGILLQTEDRYGVQIEHFAMTEHPMQKEPFKNLTIYYAEDDTIERILNDAGTDDKTFVLDHRKA